ncbi:HEPN domain-containing protein [Ensifer canadensis]
MAYKPSQHLVNFEARTKQLSANCQAANKFSQTQRDLRDMIFQCAIFQTCAALETYLKLLVESWIQDLRRNSLENSLPNVSRGYLAAKKFEKHFTKFAFSGHELSLVEGIVKEHEQWPVLNAGNQFPHYFDGAVLHSETTYPTLKNIKRLFSRLGIATVEAALAKRLKRDVDAMIEGFQGVRTALAHSAPPDLTLPDVKRLVKDMKDLARAIDRIFYSHVLRHGGAACWKLPAV